ncbi:MULTISPECIES: bifunctional phosphopantothenoylcysteine decarboxylase/phosphopantothenate--cysteine ligase CoaBC [Clostridium]|uniref:bifunctional phosphopantothenoylcysteine decarboxylase/phosphopantothenate--cysteine ligase CoaBC n=1 Tax=Clostridium TaxID=1485 RepID=UPI0008254E97|nr:MULTISPECIES: bifunctional phosphopantothenoylcysteine decarboxylase/phosphopantothenate--cysteine ligase CoaBC [Clostridium]PJI06645.1 bifunctional phosphopantothenoylcysteine decarboxylase/phosphopantothenate--cysteine ligase CoaBC [Clostridium sp. CT7]
MKSKNVVIGVTGGIAAYKALDVVSHLKKAGFEVDVIMTNSACKFVAPLSFQSLSGNKVITDMFEEPKSFEIQHISLAKKADIFVVVPATANIIGKVANGIADDMLSTTIMAAYGRCPIAFAPAMNTNMYKNPIVQNNIKKLREYGYRFIDPESGRLACGDVGEGKLADVDLISKTIESMLYEKKDLAGKKVMVTAGPTIAPIDPVRYITNHSTGKMGYAIAEEARDRGAEVTLISGKTNIEPPFGVKFVKVATNAEMLKEVMDNFPKSDIVIKAAAVSDYKVKNYSEIKIKKNDDSLNIEFVKDNDILRKLGQIKKNQILVGFAAESNDLIENARKKLSKKNLDYIVANNILAKDTGFASSENKVVILDRDGGKLELEKMSKRKVAENLFDLLSKKRS